MSKKILDFNRERQKGIEERLDQIEEIQIAIVTSNLEIGVIVKQIRNNLLQVAKMIAHLNKDKE